MRELGVEGLSEDRRFLVVRDPSTDEQLRVPLDSGVVELRPADGPTGSVDAPHTATGPEQPMATTLSPREIQTRVRRGESPEDIAASTGMSAGTVEAFAGPVLAEREYVAQQAARTTVRRQHVTSSGARLEALLDEHLREQGRSVETAAWDAFRREDGRWTVLVTPEGDQDAVTFLYDVQGRYVVPADDAARAMVGDVPPVEGPDMALADAIRDAAPQAPVREDDGPEPELPPFEDRTEVELELDLELPHAEVPSDIAMAESLLDSPAFSAVASLKEARDRRAKSAMTSETEPSHQAVEDPFDEAIEHDVAVPDSPAPKKRHERRHVPSWDEIMFGDRRD